MADEGEILTLKEVCDLLRAHPSTVYRLARQGKIPSFKIDQEWRFRKDLIMRWMAETEKHQPAVRKVSEPRDPS
jgi:excisionase family DNA binding protein